MVNIVLNSCKGRLSSNKRNDTPRKINMEPENDGLEDDFFFQLED